MLKPLLAPLFAARARIDRWWSGLPFVVRYREWWRCRPALALFVEIIGLLFSMLVTLWKIAVLIGTAGWFAG